MHDGKERDVIWMRINKQNLLTFENGYTNKMLNLNFTKLSKTEKRKTISKIGHLKLA